MSVKIDVVIPLYNKEDSIERCLMSVVNQTSPANQIIVVDDGSTDRSASIANSFLASTNSSYQIVSQSNSGVSSARNSGVKRCTSEYICFLDADDEWHPEFLKCQVSLIHDFPYANLYTVGQKVVEGPEIYNSLSVRESRGLRRGVLEDFFALASHGRIAHSSSVAVRKKAFFEFGGFPEGVKVGEDIFLWIQFALNGSIAYDPKILVTLHKDWDPVRQTRNKEVPYPLKYFSKNSGQISNNPGLKRYLSTVGILHVAGSRAEGDFLGASKRIWWLSKVSKYSALKAAFVCLIPSPFLIMLRSFRRSRKR